MRTLTTREAEGIEGGGFWSGVACGLGVVSSFVLWTSPDPFSKVAAVSYTGTAISCISAYL